ncbi:MAG: glycosyltransferase family 39 protein [Alphaproteobacteria bacterium]|nr:glycosyltransferase family 39 protein [Alphaproteobacteria bacterium]
MSTSASLRRLADDGLAASGAMLARVGEALLTRRRFTLAVLSYFLLLFAIQGFLFPGGVNDDSEQLLYSQSFQFGYGLRNPPLYTWLVIAFQRVFGVSLAALAAVKFLLLAGTYLLFAATALRVFDDERWAMAAALAPLAIYFVAWDAVRNYTHSVLMVCMAVLTFYCLLRIIDAGRWWWYAALGLAIGAGTLAKYNYLLFAGALLVSGLVDPDYRRRLMERRMALTLLVAALALLPFTIYAMDQSGGLGSRPVGRKADTGLTTAPLSAIQAGLTHLLVAAASFLSPLLPMLPLFFWRAFRPLRQPGNGPRRQIMNLLGRALVVLLACVLVLELLVAPRIHIYFIFVLFPLWFFLRARLAGATSEVLARFAGTMAVLALLVPAAILVKFATDPLKAGRKPYVNLPYPALAASLKAAGFAGGTIYSWDESYGISGNLRLYLPAARYITPNFAHYAPPARPIPGQCLAIWEIDRFEGIDGRVAEDFGRRFGMAPGFIDDARLVELPMVNGWGRMARFKYWLFPEGIGDCR